MVYTTCSSYPEENEEVVRRALEQANANSEQEGDPKQHNFRSLYLSTLVLSLNLSVIDFLCLFASLSASLLCCLSASLQTGFLSKPQHTSHRENIIKVAILYFSILLCEKASFFSLSSHRHTSIVVFVCVCVKVYHSCRLDS